MTFRTKLDFSSNRQVKQHEATTTILSGGTSFGLTFSALTTGPDLTTSGVSENYTLIASTFSGNTGTTVYTWYDARMNLAINALSAITSTNSATTQTTGQVYTPSSTIVIDGNTVNLAYTGVSFDITGIAMIDLGGGNYSGTVTTNNLDILSANTLAYTGRTIWNDVSGITRTERLIVTNNPQIGYVLKCADTEGMVEWGPDSSGATASLVWTAGTGISSAVLSGSGGVASGNYSVAEGWEALASGVGAHAEGGDVVGNYTGGTASGIASHAEGILSTALGNYSHAEGALTVASGGASHAEGDATTASGVGSHSEGQNSTASGNSSHAEGDGTKATGDYSHAEGQSTTASATASHAEGSSTIALGQNSHAEGYLTIASGLRSHAEGNTTTASGVAAHAEGNTTIASGNYSHAEGNTTIASGNYSHAEGSSTVAIGSISHSEGELTAAGVRLFTVTSVVDGLITISDDIDYTSEFQSGQLILDGQLYYYNQFGGSPGFSSPDFTIQITDGVGINSGNFVVDRLIPNSPLATVIQGNYSHAECGETLAMGDYSHAEGYGGVASGSGSHAEGGTTLASGQYSHAEGSSTTASGVQSHAEGLNTFASGDYSHAQGYQTTAIGPQSHAGGQLSIASGSTSFVHGSGSTAGGNGTVVLGDGITGTTDNTTYVNAFNIKTIGGGTPLINLGLDSSGNVVTGSTSTYTFTGGTVTGPTIFTGGLSANTFSATTYYNLPTDITVTGGTYSTGTAVFTNNTGGTFNVSGFNTSTDTFVSAFTYNTNTFTITNSTGGTLSTTINTVTGLTVNGNLTITGNTITKAISGTSMQLSGSGQNILTIIGSGSTNPLFIVSGSTGELFSISDSMDGSLYQINDVSGNTIVEVFSDTSITLGSYNAPSLYATTATTANSGATSIYSFPISGYTGTFVDYTVLGSLGARAGSMMGIFSGTSVQYTETSTNDIGNTSSIEFLMTVAGGIATIKTSASTNSWTVKTIVRSI